MFESGGKGAGQILKVFTENERNRSNKEHWRLLSLRFENKHEFVPLQAADILAYEIYRQLPKQIGTDARPPRLYSLNTLLEIPSDWGRLDARQLREWAEIIRIRLDSKELWYPPYVPMIEKPIIPISITDFQNRWRWANQFMGRASGQMGHRA